MKKILPLLTLLFLLASTPSLAHHNPNEGECDPNEDWKNHGAYVSCVAHTHPGGEVVSAAAQSDVGKKDVEESASPSPSVSPSPSPEVSPSPTPEPSPSPSPEASPSPSPEGTALVLPGSGLNLNNNDALEKIIEKLEQLLERLQNLLS